MSARSGEWHLLGVDSDPLPGDPLLVTTEVTHYTDTAAAIRDQVTRLKTMAEGNNELVGKYAPELEKSADELGEKLEQAQGRFDTVAEQLKIWQPVLDDGRTQTMTYLNQAEDAQAAADAHKEPETPVDPTDTAAVDAENLRSDRLDTATGELDAVKRRFDGYMSQVSSTAKSVADAIDDASHDELKNHRFDGMRKWVHDHADLLKFIADVLTFIATILIVAVLLLSNPAGWLIIVAMVATALAMVIHTTLAAQGDGSWVDVGLDAFALLTLGGGGTASLLARGARSTRLALAGFGEGSAAFSRATAAARTAFSEAGLLSKAGVWLSESNPIARTLTGASEYGRAFIETIGREVPDSVSALSRLSFGEKEAAALYKDISLLKSEYGSGFLLDSAHNLLNVQRGAFTSGAIVDVTGKIFNDSFQNPTDFNWDGVEPWVQWKEEHTVNHSAGW